MDRPCPRCRGSGLIADTPEGEPWSDWLDLPLRSSIAVLVGAVKPIACPRCGGTGRVPLTGVPGGEGRDG